MSRGVREDGWFPVSSSQTLDVQGTAQHLTEGTLVIQITFLLSYKTSFLPLSCIH